MVKDDASDGRDFVSVEQLRVGLYVFIDLPWYRHPFMLNEFMIRSAEQIRELKTLGQSRFRYDPSRSDAPADETATPPDTPGPAAATPPDAPGPTAPPVEPPGGPTPVAATHAPRTVLRERALAEHRRRVAQVEKSFLKSSTLLRNLNRKLLTHPDGTLGDMRELVDQMVLSFLEHPEVTLHVMSEKCHEDFYSHVLNVSVLSMMLTRGLGFSADEARILGLGALLHDIGLMEVPDRVLNKSPEEYTKAERELRAMHCEYGLRIGRQIGLPPDVLSIIHQHHEMADGSGYPLGLTLDAIAMPARVVAMVNFYDNLCNPLDFSLAMTPHEALSFMFARRRNKFDARILQQMIRCLGVYPPGSIVMLSNDAIGMVMSINPAKPLRPWVMLYDASTPKENAPLINLEEETDVNISKAIRPALLPPQIHAYLSPRKRVAYFFDSTAQHAQGGE